MPSSHSGRRITAASLRSTKASKLVPADRSSVSKDAKQQVKTIRLSTSK